ncbi:MAG TPA: hypothetical protein VH079_02155 [Terriglobales bacterium]|jgi:hypothetical protein|nr:hypothetical protein [Terriglobales bacterium]
MATIANRPLAERLLEEINAKEDLSLRLGDALDVKASIGLAVILFLGTQSAYFLDKHLPRIGVAIQIFSISCILIAAACALAELWPRTYTLPEPESKIIPKRIEELTKHFSAYPNDYPDVASSVAQAFTNDEIDWATSRIAENNEKNSRKSDRLNYSFCFTLAAVILNQLTLVIVLSSSF